MHGRLGPARPGPARPGPALGLKIASARHGPEARPGPVSRTRTAAPIPVRLRVGPTNSGPNRAGPTRSGRARSGPGLIN